MTIKVTYNVTDVYVTQDVSPVYINVSYSGGGNGGAAVWGGITGTLSDQTDLQTALDGKFDDPTGTTSQYLRGDGSLATFPAIPSGTVTSVGLTMPSAFSVANSPVTSSGTLSVTGAGTTAQYIRGDGSLATFPSLTGFVPYTGATGDVDLGTHRILAQNATISSSGSGDTVTLNHSSGSGIGLNITKGGNGEGLYINKTGGSGNAATIIGTINATTLVKSGGTSSQFLKADGTVDSSVYVPTSTTLTINGVTLDLSANRTFTVGSVTGSGASGQVAYWTGASAQSGSNNLFWDNANGRLGIGISTPTSPLHITATSSLSTREQIIRASVSDDSDSSFIISNGSAGNNLFAPSFGGYCNSGSVYSLNFAGFTTAANDSADSPLNFGLVHFIAARTTTPLDPYNGTLSAPQSRRLFTFGNITNNGILTIYATTNVGINSTTDSGQRLQVQGTTLLNGNVTFSSATGMFWDATNSRLGIGTNAPAYTFHMRGARFAQTGTTTTAATTLYYVSDNTSISNNSYILFGIDINGGTTGFGQAGTYLSTGRNGTGTLRPIILHNFDSQPIIFATGNTERARIFGTGNFGIGTGATDSGERLQVTGTMKVTGDVSIVANSSGTTLSSYNGTSSIVFLGNTGSGTVAYELQSLSTRRFRILANATSTTFESSNQTGSFIFNNRVSLPASTTTKSTLNIASGTAPTSPNDGDIWYDGTNIYMRVGATTKTFTLI